MTFPQPLDIRVDLHYGGQWNDITDYVRRADDGIQIGRGRTDTGFDADPSSCKLRIDNTDGRFSNRNPASPLYGKAGRNTPIRVSIPAASAYLWAPGSPGDYSIFNTDRDGVEDTYSAAASTPDASGLGITGDLDVRFDADMWWLRDHAALCSKFDTTSDERSWVLSVDAAGHLLLEWTTDGTAATLTSITSTVPLSAVKGRLAVRATLDTDNGASGNTVTFYTADTIAGAWTQLGDPVTTSGTTSVYDSTAPVEVAGAYTRQFQQPRGQIYGFELRSGIAGTVVADPDFTAETAGTTSFTDDAGNTWTIGSRARIDDRDYRFHGEVASWPQAWDPSGTDVYADITAYGILRRLRHNEKALKSALYRATTTDPTAVAYWPMEEADGAAYFASPMPGVAPMTFTRDTDTKPDLAAFDEFDGSEPVPTFADTYFAASVPPYRLASAGAASELRFLFNNDHDPVFERIATIRTSGTAREWRIFYGSGGNLSVDCYDENGAQLLDGGAIAFEIHDRPVRIGFRFAQDGADVSYAVLVADAESGDWTHVDEDSATIDVISGQTAGIITEIDFNAGGGLGDTTDKASVGHVSIHKDQVVPVTTATDVYNTLVVSAPPHGWKAEAAGRRFQRLCTEQTVPFSMFGASRHTLSMSAQRPDPLSKLLADCAIADEGLLVEPRDAFELAMRTRDTMVNPPAALTLDYSASEPSPPFLPVEDDDDSVNDVTAKSTGGSNARAVLEQGALSVLDPPDGIGRYETEIERNAEFAEQMPNYADWALRLGTLDAPRYPSVIVELARAEMAGKAAAAKAVEIGDRIVVENLPDWLPPDDVVLRVEGVSEALTAEQHTITFACSPGEVYDFAVVGTDRYDSDHTYLRAAVDTDDAALEIVVRRGPLWDTAGGYDVTVGGEEMTVTSAAGAAAWGIDLTDTFARTSASTWGSADTGHVWTTFGGVAADYRVVPGSTTPNGVGIIDVGAVNARRYSLAPQAHTDIDLTFEVLVEDLAATADTNVYAVARYSDSSNWCSAQINFEPDQGIAIGLTKTVAAATSAVTAATATALTHTTATWYKVRFRILGTSLMAKIWEADDDEPAAWTVTGTDSDLTTGTHIGVAGRLQSGSTVALPAGVLVTRWDAATPQTMTVTRSVNGVTKSQEPGQQLHLAARPWRNFDRYPFDTDVVDWFTGEVLGNLRSPRTVCAESGVDIANIASSSFALNSTAEVGVRFMAPLTGRVLVTTAGMGRDNSNDNRVYFNPDIWRVKDDDNTWSRFHDGRSANVHRYGLAIEGEAVDPAGHSQTYMFEGLRPGRVYYARILTAADITTSASADVAYRSITVEPAP
ncbi:hypothetical protein E1281_01155 [Actinomadura sp. KC345]|uniref:hypothetical protein n=1 Tax=Actinomadura sp. KC345 TaxID=2530371 RepID=UPI00104B9BC1|nr:hypothetical protein [Actinomadura sp. KC345]TDC58587.1 hypothetical protein E1281_01155 [Actinomadura sp. KC345]